MVGACNRRQAVSCALASLSTLVCLPWLWRLPHRCAAVMSSCSGPNTRFQCLIVQRLGLCAFPRRVYPHLPLCCCTTAAFAATQSRWTKPPVPRRRPGTAGAPRPEPDSNRQTVGARLGGGGRLLELALAEASAWLSGLALGQLGRRQLRLGHVQCCATRAKGIPTLFAPWLCSISRIVINLYHTRVTRAPYHRPSATLTCSGTRSIRIMVTVQCQIKWET